MIVEMETLDLKSRSPAIVEARFNAVFRFTIDKQGNWQAVDVRTGDRNWESIELIQTAVRKEKALRRVALELGYVLQPIQSEAVS